MQTTSLLISLFATFCVAGSVGAQQKYEHRTCYTGPHQVINHSKDAMGGGYSLNGMVVAEPNDPLHNAAGVCIGSWTLVSGQYDETGSCEYTLPSGDRVFGVYSRRNQEAGLWKVVSATGKLQGLTHQGNWQPFTAFPQPTGQLSMCGKEWGNWKSSP